MSTTNTKSTEPIHLSRKGDYVYATSATELVFNKLLYVLLPSFIYDCNNPWHLNILNETIQFYNLLISSHQSFQHEMCKNLYDPLKLPQKSNQYSDYDMQIDDDSDESIKHDRHYNDKECSVMDSYIHNMISVNRHVFDILAIYNFGNFLSDVEQSQVLLRTSVTTPIVGIRNPSRDRMRLSDMNSFGRIPTRTNSSSAHLRNSSSSSSSTTSTTTTTTNTTPLRNSNGKNSDDKNSSSYIHTSFTPLLHPYARAFDSPSFVFDVKFFDNNFENNVFTNDQLWSMPNAFKFLLHLANIVLSNLNSFHELINNSDSVFYGEYINTIFDKIKKSLFKCDCNLDDNNVKKCCTFATIFLKRICTSLFVFFCIMYVTDNYTKQFVRDYGRIRLGSTLIESNQNIQWIFLNKNENKMLDCIIHFAIEMYLGVDFLPNLILDKSRTNIVDSGLYQMYDKINGSIREYYSDDIIKPDHALMYYHRNNLILFLENNQLLFQKMSESKRNGIRSGSNSSNSSGTDSLSNSIDGTEDGDQRMNDYIYGYLLYFGDHVITSDVDFVNFMNESWIKRNEDPTLTIESMISKRSNNINCNNNNNNNNNKSCNDNRYTVMTSTSIKYVSPDMYALNETNTTVPNYWSKENVILCMNMF